MGINGTDISVGDVLNNSNGQVVMVMGEPFRDPSDNNNYYCRVQHIRGPYVGEVVDKYFIANRDGFLFVFVESKGTTIEPKNILKKFNFHTI